MIITDRFVYIHQPKTGGTFVSTALSRVHGSEAGPDERGTAEQPGRAASRAPYGQFTCHGHIHAHCRDIPEPHQRKKILATVRSPYDWYVSHYTFGWWQTTKRLPYFRKVIPDLDARYPDFPDIGFADFVGFASTACPAFPQVGFRDWPELTASVLSDLPHAPRRVTGLGPATWQFIDFYFRDPEAVLLGADEEYFCSGRYRSEMFAIHFCRTDRLNQELYRFLLGEGYRVEDIHFILDLERIVPHDKGRAAGDPWERYYTPELKAVVRERERHLFTVFPEFDV